MRTTTDSFPIQTEKLIATRMARQSGDPRLPVAEEIVTAGLLDLGKIAHLPDETVDAAERLWMPTLIARTGGIFVLKSSDIGAFNAMRSEYDSANTIELPPLPFPLSWYETWSEQHQKPLPMLAPVEDWEGVTLALISFGVMQVEPMTEWYVYGVFCPFDPERDIYSEPLEIIRWRLVGKGHELFPADADPTVNAAGVLPDGVGLDRISDSMLGVLGFPLEVVTLVTTLGVTHEPVPVPRARRREFLRHNLTHPTVYLVEMGNAGESFVGHGDREYHCRWIVRGHYRRQEGGQYCHPVKGQCTWVRPYVKGPKGAPWKGRPVYHA